MESKIAYYSVCEVHKLEMPEAQNFRFNLVLRMQARDSSNLGLDSYRTYTVQMTPMQMSELLVAIFFDRTINGRLNRFQKYVRLAFLKICFQWFGSELSRYTRLAAQISQG